jgi:hypothetical protein
MTFSCAPVVSGKEFMKHQARDVVDTGAEFQNAMEAMMGCGGGAADADKRAARLLEIEKLLTTSWKSLPKNEQGKVEWRMLRYVAHRFFMQQFSLFIRGFEPARQVNESSLGSADILNKHMPAIVEKLIASRHADDGFTLEDAVTMIATLEQVIFDSESHLLETVYNQQHLSLQQSINHQQVSNLIEAYMVHWMIGLSDMETVHALLNKPHLLPQAFPHWNDIKHFANGMVQSMEFSQSHGVTLAQDYSFAEVHQVVGSITKTFASYWETECQTIKSSLIALDKTGTGRIALADFYGANSDGEWRFGESEAYLRELGALDESSAWRGKQVIIPNYLLGASNCIVTTPNYLVCCVNECEDVLNGIEDAIGSATAVPSAILPLVEGITNYNDDRPKIDKALRNQLQRIAEAHGGKVPLHGRLFSQWLHYVFPRECPFPHKVGSFSSLTPAEFGDQYMASENEVSTHASKRGDIAEIRAKEEQEWMSQWNEEEELHADYAIHLSAPWEGGGGIFLGGGFLLAAGAVFWLLAGKGSKEGKSTPAGFGAVYEPKAHFV